MPTLLDVNVPDALGTLQSEVCRVASGFDARALDRDGAVAAMSAWSKVVHAAHAALALAAARVAECGPPPSAGASSAADFVAKQTGTTANKANETIKTGAGLQQNPKTRQQATEGKLSGEQTAAITDALAVAPGADRDLLHAAERDSVGGLRQKCAAAKAAHTDMATTEKRIHANRCVRRYRDAEGAEHLHATGTKRQMARIDHALKPLVDEIFKTARTDGAREPHEAYLFDALVALADARSGTPATTKAPTIRHLGVLRVDLTALVRGHPVDGETCEIAGLGPVAVETAREMLGESILKLVITKGVDVVHVTHLGRGPNTAQKIALLWQQPKCSREGCDRSARLEYDHKYDAEYHKTRHTRLDETDPLCDPDHGLRTLEGWALVEGTGTRPMVPPDDPRHPRNTGPPP